jgi:type II secretory pathway pseudopilin PulG
MIELIVVVGIIAILAGLLLPAVNHMRVAAQITGQKADFQTISAALEQYKADFGDYPRNTVLPTWNLYQTTSNGATNTPAPVYLTLASALIGPGPLSTQTTGSGVYELGDGADGFGFAAQSVNIGVHPGGQYSVSSLQLTSAPYSITLNAFPPQLNNMTSTQSGSITLSVGTPYEETIGFTVNQTVSPNQLLLQAEPVFISNTQHQTTDSYLIKLPTARVTPNYLSADNFKVAFIPATAASGPGAGVLGPAGEPVILDRWGQVIQYFPRYGPASNRSSDSALFTGIPAATAASVIAGPLYGYSEPKSVDANSTGQYAMYDFRDGTPFYTASNLTSPVQLWVGGNGSGSYWDPSTTLEWMLGNATANTANTGFTNYVAPPDKLNYDGPYILISAGPNGPSGSPNPNGGTNLGGYCSFLNAQSGSLTDNSSNNLTRSEMLQAFTNSENVYNFDHP